LNLTKIRLGKKTAGFEGGNPAVILVQKGMKNFEL